jgi:anaerobic nitric oxide reductase transcription regulator
LSALSATSATSRPRTEAAATALLPATGERPTSLADAVEDFKRALIRRTLGEAGGSWAEAARLLGMHRSNLHHMATRLGIRDP